ITKQVTTDSKGNFEAGNVSEGDWIITEDSLQTVADWDGYQLSYTDIGQGAVKAGSPNLSLKVHVADNKSLVNGI
ncbi:hypothetical protein, partial [Gilliamella sp. B3804]